MIIRNMKTKHLFLIALAFIGVLACKQAGESASAPQVPVRQIMFQKLFPLTYALETQAKDVVTADASMASVSTRKYNALLAEEDAAQAPELSKLDEEDIFEIGCQLGHLSPMLKDVIAGLRASGKYGFLKEVSDSEFVASAWDHDARAMNHIIDVYALGEKPRYAAIDSIDFKIGGNEIKYVRSDVRYNTLLAAKDQPFYSLALETVLDWLDANGRTEPADFEPMAGGINKAAYTALRSVAWDKYPYSVILVLGAGPSKEGVNISAQSRMRARYAAMLYNEGKAPVIVVSGGRVHPFKTPYSEAEEMKTYLMETWGIPESAIIAEPHARHTTTNIRNTVRIMMEQGIPMEKPGLITSGSSHIDYASGDYFQELCKKEMWQVPFKLGYRLSPRVVEFYPQPCASIIATLEDPLDP